MDMREAIKRLRIEIGDPKRSFQTNSIGDGMTSDYDLPKQNIDLNDFSVSITNGATVTDLQLGTGYMINPQQGFLQLASPVPFGATLSTSGTAWGLFTDRELERFIRDSVLQHTYGRTIKERIHTYQGFISYREMPMNLHNLPMIEEPLLIMLCSINVMWSLANDAATDTDIQTAEGTNVDRLGRYRQLIGHIAELQERYEMYCGQLNVGAFRTVTRKLRRVSLTTGRYVPTFEDREYDDARWPVRELPQIDNNDLDNSGIPSPLWNSQGY
jgi:hypothetical protein